MGEIHFLDVGCADMSIIKANNNTYLIDCYSVEEFKYLLPTNKKIKALFVTHQHYDHFLGMKYLIENDYSIDYLLYSPYERRIRDNSVEYDEWQDFNSYVKHYKNSGTKIYTPYRQSDFEQPWWNTDRLKFYIIGPVSTIADSETRELHDASLVFLVCGEYRMCLFTGDASDKSLEWIAQNTQNYCNDILHASHHGSINGANLAFIKKAGITDTIISTKSGVHSNIPHPTALQRYREYTSNSVHRTDTNGSLSLLF